MADTAALVDIVDRYSAQSVALRSRVVGFVESAWDRLADYRDVDIAAWVREVAPVVRGGQRVAAALTDSYLATLEAAVVGTPAAPFGISAELLTDIRGVPAEAVYARAGQTVWRALADGYDLRTAAELGRTRAVSLASTDLQLARTHTASRVLSRSNNVVGYRRVVTGSRSCGLCAVAATQRYRRGDLMPIHPGCHCTVVPIYGTEDPGQVFDEHVLDELHAAIAERFGASARRARGPVDYRNVIVVREHGELGPVLAVKGHRFTGPGQL